jgi:hypothetical protein
MWANMDARQRKKRRTSKRKKGKKEQIPASVRKFEKNMKQLLELQRLARLIRS